MNRIKINKFGGALFATMVFVVPLAFVGAQNVTTSSLSGNVSTCINFPSNIFRGERAGTVMQLQSFLVAQNDLHVAATGYFGPLTFSAVENFQSSQGVPSTGFVGPLTRAAIGKITCGVVSTPPAPTSTTTPNIYGLNPTSGPVGTTITVEGSGFSATGNVIHFGGGAIGNVSAQPAIFACPMMPAGSTGGCGPFSQTLSFTLPSSMGPYCAPDVACPMYEMLVTPNTYNVYVVDGNGTSNTEQFTVTGNNPLVPLQ